MATQLSQDDLDDLVCDFLARRLVTADSLVAYVSKGGRGWRRPGSRAVSRCIDGSLAWRTESVAEQRLLRLWRQSDLPTPTTQLELRDDQGGFVARVDLALPDLRIAVEMDSFRYHGDARSFHEDRLRAMRLTSLGWRVLAVSPQNLRRDPDAVLSAIAAAVAEARRTGRRAA